MRTRRKEADYVTVILNQTGERAVSFSFETAYIERHGGSGCPGNGKIKCDIDANYLLATP